MYGMRYGWGRQSQLPFPESGSPDSAIAPFPVHSIPDRPGDVPKVRDGDPFRPAVNLSSGSYAVPRARRSRQRSFTIPKPGTGIPRKNCWRTSMDIW